VDSTPKRMKLLDVFKHARQRRPLLALAKDMAGALRALP